jgi:hypothetical protein
MKTEHRLRQDTEDERIAEVAVELTPSTALLAAQAESLESPRS